MKRNFTWLIVILFWGTPVPLPALTLEEGLRDLQLKQAWAAIHKNQPTQALNFLKSIPQEGDQRVYFHLINAYALEKLNQPSEAMEHFRTAYLSAPTAELKELTLLERGDGYFRIKNYYEAKMVYGMFLNQYKQSRHLERANLGMAQSLVQIGMLPAALTYFDKAGNSGEVALGKANLLHRLGRTQEAHEYFQKGISQGKVLAWSEESLLNYGENQQQLGRDAQAQLYLSYAYKDPKLKSRADLNLGLVALKAKHWEEAQKYFQSALSAPDRKIRQEALFYLAESQWEGGKKKDAYKLLVEYRQTYLSESIPDLVFLRLAKMDLEEGRWDKAGERIKEFVLRSKLKKESISEIEGLISQLKHQALEFIPPLWKAIAPKFLPLASEPFLVSLAEGFKKDELAFFEIQRWLSQHGSEKTKLKSTMNVAFYQIGKGNLNMAIETLKGIGKGKIPKDEMLRLEARIHYAKKDYPAAVERLLSLSKLEPEDLPILEEGLLWARNVDRALIFFERALSQMEGNSGNHIKLADALYERGKKKEALSHYQKALDKDPLNEWALYRSGLLIGGEEGLKKLGSIKNDGSLIGRLAKASAREKNAEKKLEDLH
ncbi:MAG TPA: tetratricopeptide repeat protein [Thermodesulfobacteriota bacterium]|nr:tetratricopeptide repeat protein [Thermodesulfobacteriota bacterium]